MSSRLSGKVALITGASAGIGEALAKDFASRGASLVLTARRVARLESLAAELQATYGVQVLVCAADVTEDGALEAAVARARAELGGLDYVVANAGFGVSGKLRKLSLGDYRRQFETNVFGVLRTVYATVDALAERKGVLGLVGSVSGYLSTPRQSAYSMSKFAVRALAESLHGELGEEGIAVTHIAPGFIQSEIRKIDNKGSYQETREDPAPPWLVMPAEKAAKQMVSALIARKREIVVTGHGKAAVALARHTPWVFPLSEALVSKATKRMAKVGDDA